MITSLQPLGDQAVLAACAMKPPPLRLAAAVRRLAPAWLLDVVQAYTTVAVFFDLDQIRYAPRRRNSTRCLADEAAGDESQRPAAPHPLLLRACELDLAAWPRKRD